MIVHIKKHQLETDLMVSDKPAIAEKKESRNFSVSASLITKHCLFLTWKKWIKILLQNLYIYSIPSLLISCG